MRFCPNAVPKGKEVKKRYKNKTNKKVKILRISLVLKDFFYRLPRLDLHLYASRLIKLRFRPKSDYPQKGCLKNCF
jgi:hypothetical protein